MARVKRYVATLNERRSVIETREQQEDLLNEVGHDPSADLLVEEERGQMRGLERLLYFALGLGTRTDVPCFTLLRAQNEYALAFLSEAWSERRAFDPSRKGQNEGVSFRLSSGEAMSIPKAKCLPEETAMKAVRHFFEHRRPPAWLSYDRAQ